MWYKEWGIVKKKNLKPKVMCVKVIAEPMHEADA